jgi:hypothetical protein
MTDEEAGEVLVCVARSATHFTETERIAFSREAGGNPFLLEQLAHYLPTHPGARAGGAPLAHVLEQRLGELPERARGFLEVLAVCGRPMAPEVVREAAGWAGDERSLIAMLRAGRLLRNSGSASRIEVYHDRIREALATQLSPHQTRNIHGVLLHVLTAKGVDDPEALFEHARGAADVESASRHAIRAAQRADAALAFDRAASFYRSAMELTPHAPDAIEWKQRLAASLANGGRTRDAGEAYLAAAEGAGRARRVDLQRRAAEQFLFGGHIDRGLDVIREVLADVGMRFPRGRGRAIASFLLRRAQLRWRGLTFAAREPDQIPAEDLLRIDTCRSVAVGLMLVDHLLAADFQTRFLLLALDAGEPYRVACGITGEVALLATNGDAGRARTAECIARAGTLAATSGHPHAIALSTLAAGLAAFLEGRWRQAALLNEQALRSLRDHCVGVTWETSCAQIFLLGALQYEGAIREVSRRLPAAVSSAREHGNLYFETELCTRMVLVWLAGDDPDAVDRQANDVIARWSHRGYQRLHYNHALVRIQTELYRGRARQAWQLVAENWRPIKRSLLLRVQWTRLEASYVRARCALLMAASGEGRTRFLAVARREAGRIEAERAPWCDPLASLIRAAVARMDGQADESAARLTAAVDAFDRADMKLYAAVARRRLGALRQDAAGSEMMRRADDWMAAQGIVNAARITRLIAPGFPDSEGV